MLHSKAFRPVGSGVSRASAAPRLAQITRRTTLVKAAQTDLSAAEDEIDPNTGMPLRKNSASSPTAGNSVQVGKYEWAYRRGTIDPAKADSNKLPVVLLHGLGSNSYSFRNTLGMLGADGYDAIAPDWLGHGCSDKPTSGFDFSEEAYIKELDEFIKAVGVKEPFALVVNGYILGQYALLYALKHADKIDRLMILNTPVSLKTKLRPDLAAYKSPIPFMRPKADKPFVGDIYNANGGPYAMARKDADVDYDKLLRKVDEGFLTWRKPTVLLFGANDTFMDAGAPFDFLENKRTNMKTLGHMPQEDYASALHEQMVTWLSGGSENFTAPPRKFKMTKKGGFEK
eukprot:gene29355-12447_t